MLIRRSLIFISRVNRSTEFLRQKRSYKRQLLFSRGLYRCDLLLKAELKMLLHHQDIIDSRADPFNRRYTKNITALYDGDAAGIKSRFVE